MRRSSFVLINDQATGADKLVELGYYLPEYNIGEMISYVLNKSDEEVGPVQIVGMDVSVNFDKTSGGYITETLYRTDDGMLVEEDEITNFVDSLEEANDI